MTFKDWIKSFYLVQHPMGYLAWDISTDDNFPDVLPDEHGLEKGLTYLKKRTNNDLKILSYYKIGFYIFMFDSVTQAIHTL